MYYIEFYERRSGVSLTDFHTKTLEGFPEWARRYSEDELVLNIGRTWRMGPYPYLLIWRCPGFERLDAWDSLFKSGTVDDLEVPVFETMTTFASGIYRDVLDPLFPDAPNYLYLETFSPSDDAATVYGHRAAESGLPLALCIERVGLLGPDPGGIAVFLLANLADAERLALSTPIHAREAGTYAPVGQEIL
jgi:hypothetical protein